MKKHLSLFAVALMALCFAFASCQKDDPNDQPNNNSDSNDNWDPADTLLVGVYDLTMVYDSVTTSDGTWFSEEDFEYFTHKVNPPKYGYLTIAEGNDGKLNVTATFVEESGEEKQFFTTTATENNGILKLDNCTSDYYYSSIEDYISFVFRNFANNMPKIYFKSVYTLNLGADDFHYLTSYNCTKRK